MALTIEGATIGFNQNNVADALNNLQTHVINDTITKMNESMASLREYVDNAWVGQSAETFKENMEYDKDEVIAGLNEAYEQLKAEMYDIVNTMAETDNALVTSRRGE